MTPTNADGRLIGPASGDCRRTAEPCSSLRAKVAAPIAVLLLVGCSTSPVPAPPSAASSSPGVAVTPEADENGGANSCAAIFDYDGRRYSFVPEDVRFDVAEQIGQATIPPCSDGGPSRNGTPVEQRIAAYRIDDLDPEDAFAIGPSEKPTMVAVLGENLPPAVEEFLKQNG